MLMRCTAPQVNLTGSYRSGAHGVRIPAPAWAIRAIRCNQHKRIPKEGNIKMEGDHMVMKVECT